LLRLLLFLTLFGCFGCFSKLKEQKTAAQGVRGRVTWAAGNQMPGKNKITTGEESKPVGRTLHFYELIHNGHVSHQEGFYSIHQFKRVATVTANSDGTFEVAMLPGKYSLFSQEERGLWANLTDGNGFVNPVEVKPGQWTEIDFLIDYEAYY
jgi:hypothetical protein